ncbi:hypothetical protein QBC38DRAFT_201475 [Podospora fimiseda]|uniref:Cyclic nucleotide-binding domain-containing protein n=1 Tax=Podospora fimiseda TaxID=252190 RepID=A0AAN7H854_9PEZI|nr:hypothetical protein QBC38DRAFT_201475 [Podospora fimiseda]
MRRSRTPPPAASPYRALAHHHAHHGAASQGRQQGRESISSVIRSFNVETNPSRPVRPSPLTASTIPDMPLELLDRIRSFPLFMSAPDDFLAAIGAHLKLQTHSVYDHILTEGDEAKAMYWLVRGIVAVTSRDGEAVYAELKPGAFFGEIGVLMDMPRTATVIAKTKCMLAVLKREDLQAELPKYPEMEKAIRQEAQERLTILRKKRGESSSGPIDKTPATNGSAVVREMAPGQVNKGDTGSIQAGSKPASLNTKKRKSPSPSLIEDPSVSGSALGSGLVNVRKTLKELPLFAKLDSEVLHFLGLSAQPKSYAPFTDIVQQGSPGNEIFFIVRGEAEVIREPLSPPTRRTTRSSYARPRLSAGQYFGEVASLGLAEERTATVRSITAVECLVIGRESLEKLWKIPEIKAQVEETARKRYQVQEQVKPKVEEKQEEEDEDVEMRDPESHALSDEDDRSVPTPTVTFTVPSNPGSPTNDESRTRQPSDPDPFLSVDMENLRNRRRNSLAPPMPQTDNSAIVGASKAGPGALMITSRPPSPQDDSPLPAKRARTLPRNTVTSRDEQGKPAFSDSFWVSVFQNLNIIELIRLKSVSRKWRELLTTSPDLCTKVDLSPFNNKVTDWSVVNILAPFIGNRPTEIDISNCFHITDEGFQAIYRTCGKNVKSWKMRSVWEVSASQILEMSDNAKGLEEVDWSNCRKVGDNLLVRVVGWVVPEPQPPRENKNVVISSSAAKGRRASQYQQRQQQQQQQQPNPNQPPPGTVIGCPKLRRLNLSYCKHITDRSMAHLAMHASKRIESLSLTRCTSITDAGFQQWVPYRFTQLTTLVLADCTYLTDNAIVSLVNAAKNLKHLDLSFCCALSDTSTEVVALGLPALRELKMAFCGSAVSDASLGCIALHLNELRGLSVRGCVRVTGNGVENVLEGCGRLEWLDVSQCKNLQGWVDGGGVKRWGFDEREVTGERGSVAELRALAMRSAGNGVSQATNSKGGKIGPGGVGYGHGQLPGPRAFYPPRPVEQGPVMRPVIPPRGAPPSRRMRKPVKFVVQKGAGGLR